MSGTNDALSHCASFDSPFVQLPLDDSFHIDRRRVDLVPIQLADFDQLFDFGNCDFGSCRHHWVEIPRRFSIDQIARLIAFPGLHKGKVGRKTSLHDIGTALELACFFPFGDDRANTGGRVEGGNTGTSGTNPLRECPLRNEFQLDSAVQDHLFQQFVFADVRSDVMHDLPGSEQKAVTNSIDSDIVADGVQILCALADECTNKVFGHAAEAEAADHNRRTIKDVVDGLVGVGKYFVHLRALPDFQSTIKNQQPGSFFFRNS